MDLLWKRRAGTVEVTSGSELPHLKIYFDDKDTMRALNDILSGRHGAQERSMTEDDGWVRVTPVMNWHFSVGDRVRKVKGYEWPGVVVAAFTTLDYKPRYVVECTVPEVAGALHIYNGEQLELDQK